MEARKREILEQTKLSLQEVGRQYQEQRRFIEEQLEKRRQLKLQGKPLRDHSNNKLHFLTYFRLPHFL